MNNNNGRIKVLVIDDDAIQRMVITEALRDDELDIMEAESGRQAVDLLKKCSGDSCPRIIITDLQMPEMDGYELISYIRHNELHYTYIIVLTSNDDPETTIRCLSLGADDFLHKPGPLTDEECIEMKKHTSIGGKLLHEIYEKNKTPYTRFAWQIAMFHHEKFDGSGYPEGLAGENIPLAARIISVADAYDAMTSERCYKKFIP